MSRMSDWADSGKWVSYSGWAVLALPAVTEFVTHNHWVAVSVCTRP